MAISDSKLKAMLRGHDDDTPRKVADRDGLSVLWRNSGKVTAFFKIVVAQSCFKQPLFAPARVSRAAPDLASRHR